MILFGRIVYIIFKSNRELQNSITQKYKKNNIILDETFFIQLHIEGERPYFEKIGAVVMAFVQKYCKGDVVAFFECFAHSRKSSKIIGILSVY